MWWRGARRLFARSDNGMDGGGATNSDKSFIGQPEMDHHLTTTHTGENIAVNIYFIILRT